jgi:hypothetical protein
MHDHALPSTSIRLANLHPAGPYFWLCALKVLAGSLPLSPCTAGLWVPPPPPKAHTKIITSSTITKAGPKPLAQSTTVKNQSGRCIYQDCWQQPRQTATQVVQFCWSSACTGPEITAVKQYVKTSPAWPPRFFPSPEGQRSAPGAEAGLRWTLAGGAGNVSYRCPREQNNAEADSANMCGTCGTQGRGVGSVPSNQSRASPKRTLTHKEP